MKTKLQKRIYKAQCIGNVEPIEHMVPYPNLRALVDGQNVKYGEKMVYGDLGLTSDKVYRLAQQTANWLVAEGVQPKDRILIDQLPFPQCEILAFGIWTLGASMVLTSEGDLDAIDLYEDQTYYTQLQPNSMAWVILQTMLPLYTGAPLTSDNPDITLGTAADDFEIQWHWDTLDETSPPSLYTCNENTAFLSMNKMPIHLTAMNDDTRPSLISGHSVMMGYLDDSLNEKVFQKDALKIKAS